jgi:thiamine-phosphate pyrophosphorylase
VDPTPHPGADGSGVTTATRRPTLPRGLYLVTDRALCAGRGLVESVRTALAAGATSVQYRDKTPDAARRRDEAAALVGLCREAGATFIVNDDADLAAEVGAQGVHVGRHDSGPPAVRRRHGSSLLIGVSCYDDLDRGRAAVAAGADYVAFGSAFPSPTKPGAVHAPLDLYRRAVRELTVPVVAIGGITPDNAGRLVAAGCHAVAVISAVLGAADPAEPAARLARLFGPGAGPAIERLE